jgi:dimethylaniline monooxygenase (N-oxide forming)
VPPALVTHPEILDWIHEGTMIKVFRQEITKLSGNHVYLDNGQVLDTDMLIFATGYDIKQDAFSNEDSAALGLPTPVNEYPPELKSKWEDLESRADSEILKLFPRLATPPPVKRTEVKYTPYRLYRYIVPISMFQRKVPDRSLAFVGAISTTGTALLSEAMALWAVAWLSGNLDVKLGNEELEWNVALHNAFANRRYLNYGAKTPCVLCEYMDVRILCNPENTFL